MDALPVRAHPPIPPRSMHLGSAAEGRRLRRQSGLNIRAGLRLRMRTKTPAGDRASCLRSALGGPYP